MPKTIERQGNVSVPVTDYYPQVRGGVCEYCGVIDNLRPSTEQYTLCRHYKELGTLRCSYCDESRDPEEVLRKHTLSVHGSPENPDKLIIVCDDYRCSQKHLARFKLS